MNIFSKKLVTGFILIALVTGGIYPLRANAIFGVADIAINPEGVVGWLWEVGKTITEVVVKATLETLKKRLLDQLTDETIKWIQGGGSPKFVTDFGGFLEDAGQAAIGDVAQEIAGGDLCTGIDPVRLRFQLETPVFSQRVSCTLDDIVGNIDRFAESFQSGGFIGYQELLKPQNNRWGLEIMASSEAARRKTEAQEALRQEVSSGRGFLSTKQCLEWEARGTDNNGKPVSQIYDANNVAGLAYPDSSTPPPASIQVTGVNNLQWVCSESRVTTPGTAIAEGLERSLYSDLDYLVNAQELSAYLGAIFDAAINRLIVEGVKGVQSLKPSGNTPKTDCNDSRLSSAAQSACREYQKSVKDESNLNERTRTEQETNKAALAASAGRGAAELALNQNNLLATTTQRLADCQSGRSLTCAQSPTLTTIDATSATLQGYLDEIDQYTAEITRLGDTLGDNSVIDDVLRETLESAAAKLNDIQNKIDAISNQISQDLSRVKGKLAICEDQTNATYTCSAL